MILIQKSKIKSVFAKSRGVVRKESRKKLRCRGPQKRAQKSDFFRGKI
jgi:hypothetical protein